MNVPATIGQYRILRKLGEGGMGTVYLGEHVLLGRQAAIKTLLPSLAVHQEIVERFFNEARATSGIADPGVVQVFDFGYHVDGIAYIVMELLVGESLSARLGRLGRLPLADALRIARQVAASLAAAHASGIVHRDLKPENVFLIHDAVAQGGERTKLLDFGICKVSDADDGVHTQTGTTLGTPAYMSPEQCRGLGGVDHRSDIYALGCVLFHMMTGRAPFELEGAGELIVAHLQDAPPAASSHVPAVPASLDALIACCLAKVPEDRYASMGELIVAIEAVLAEIGVPSAGDASVVEPLPSPPPPRMSSRGKRTVPAKRAAVSGEAVPTTLGTASGQAAVIEVPLARSPVRGTIAIVVIAGAITALIATRLLAGSDEVVDDTAIAAPATLGPAVPIVEATVLPQEPVADAISSVGARVETAVIADTPEPVRPRSTRPRPRPPQRRMTASPPASTHAQPHAPPEDLYDTR